MDEGSVLAWQGLVNLYEKKTFKADDDGDTDRASKLIKPYQKLIRLFQVNIFAEKNRVRSLSMSRNK